MLNYKFINWFTIGFILLLVLLNYVMDFPKAIYFLPLSIWSVFIIIGSFFIRNNFFVKSLHSNKKDSLNKVAITFDDGPNPEFTIKALELLGKYNAKATFFCIGKHIEKHPELFKQIVAKGHTVGNHTYSHQANFGFFSKKRVVEELIKTQVIIEELTGLKAKLFRPPFGVTNPQISHAIKHLNLTSIGWNIRSLDTTFRNEKMVLKRITKKTRGGDIVLLHDNSFKTIRVLEQLLIFLKKNKLEAVSVDSLLKTKAYE